MKKILLIFASCFVLLAANFAQGIVFSAQDTIDAQKMCYSLVQAIWDGNVSEATKNLDPTDTEMISDITQAVAQSNQMLTEARIQGVEIKFKVREARVKKITKSDLKAIRKMDKLPDDASVDGYLKVGVMINIDAKYQGESHSETQTVNCYVTKRDDVLFIKHVDE